MLICLVPILNVLAQSFSSSHAIVQNKVRLFPVEFTTSAYSYVMKNKDFWQAALVSAERVLLGFPLICCLRFWRHTRCLKATGFLRQGNIIQHILCSL